jgi:hypothetical protein
MSPREEALTRYLKAWGQLLLPEYARRDDLGPLRERVLATDELPSGERALLARLLGGANDGGVPTASDDDLGRMLVLLVRGQRASDTLGGIGPSDAVASVAAELDALADSSALLQQRGLGELARSPAYAWLVAFDGRGLSPTKVSTARRLLALDPESTSPQAYSTAFTTLALEAADGGRADVWQDLVGTYLTAVAPRIPGEVSARIAELSSPVIENDSRWFRARRTLEQSLELLSIARGRGADAAVADWCAIDLGLAYVHNRDLDERPPLVELDETVGLIAPELAPESRGKLVARFAYYAERLEAEPQTVHETVSAWWRDHGAASGDAKAERMVEGYLLGLELRANGGSAVGAVAPEPRLAAQELLGLYSDDVEDRIAALAWIRSSWAFNAAEGGDESEWPAARAILAEAYTRGIADPEEEVRERSVIFARRIILWYSSRDANETVRWAERVVADTRTLTSSRVVRARCLALSDIEYHSNDPVKKAAAAALLDRELEGNHADYAIVLRANTFRTRIDASQDREVLIPLFERSVQLDVEAEEHDEYEQQDWSQRIRDNTSWLFAEHQSRDRWDDAVRNAELFVTRLPDYPKADVEEFLSIRIIKDLAADRIRFAAPLRARADALVDTAEAWLAEHNPSLLRRSRLRGAARHASLVWDNDRAAGMALFEPVLAEMRALVDAGDEADGKLRGIIVDWARYLFLEAERWEVGEIDGTRRPYTLTTRGALLYFRNRCAPDDPNAYRLVPSVVRMAATTSTFLTSEEPDAVRELYTLLQAHIDPARDAESLNAFRTNFEWATSSRGSGTDAPGKRSGGWFRKGKK